MAAAGRGPRPRPTGVSPARGTPATDLDLLGRVPYFASLDVPELHRLLARCATRTFRPGGMLFEEGGPCHGLFIVMDGTVEVRQISSRGREQVFHAEGPGATLGEAPLLDGGGYIATAVASAPTRALFLPRDELMALCRRRPEVAVAIAQSLARRLRHFAGMVADLAFRPIPERLARFLVDRGSGAAGDEIDLALTQTQLAARLGTVRELVARALLQLEHAGIIARRRGRVVVRDPARLARLARGEPA